MKHFDVLTMGDAHRLGFEVFLQRELPKPGLECTVTFFQTHRLAFWYCLSSTIHTTVKEIKGVILRRIMEFHTYP